jgi:hypothetical protein
MGLDGGSCGMSNWILIHACVDRVASLRSTRTGESGNPSRHGQGAPSNTNWISSNSESVYPKFGHYVNEKNYSDYGHYFNLLSQPHEVAKPPPTSRRCATPVACNRGHP